MSITAVLLLEQLPVSLFLGEGVMDKLINGNSSRVLLRWMGTGSIMTEQLYVTSLLGRYYYRDMVMVVELWLLERKY